MQICLIWIKALSEGTSRFGLSKPCKVIRIKVIWIGNGYDIKFWTQLTCYTDSGDKPRCSEFNSHSYILRQEDPPECTACQEIYSVRHVLIDCIDLGLVRPRFYTVPDMKTLFDTVSVDRILSFIKEVNLFDKI